MSTIALPKITPVAPPNENKITNTVNNMIIMHDFAEIMWSVYLCIVTMQLQIFVPVGTAIIIVMIVKNHLVSNSIAVVYIWCAHTNEPNTAMHHTPKIIIISPYTWLPVNMQYNNDAKPKPGKIKMYTSG